MKKITLICALMPSLLMGCAGGTVSIADQMDHSILLEGVDTNQYKLDKFECSRQIEQKPSNLATTNIARFRQCLSDKGYKHKS